MEFPTLGVAPAYPTPVPRHPARISKKLYNP
jgi:hypothetical protein